MTEPKHYRQAFKDLEKAENLAEELNRLALLLGTRRDGLNTANAQRAVSKAVEELVEARQQAEDNGYRSLAVALKALGQKTPELELPQWAQFAPAHWSNETTLETVEHWRKSKLYKVKAVTPLQAQRQLDRLKPTIKLVLDELYWDPEEMEEVKKALMKLDYTDFQQELFGFLRRVTEAGEDEETEEATTETSNEPNPELEASLEEMRQALGEEFDEEAARALLVKN
jgi:multidrug efflux pump subunit AcrA (membrane-fusion protein)